MKPASVLLDAALLLDNQLCFKLYATSRAVIRAYKPMHDQLNLTYPQYLVMRVLPLRRQLLCQRGVDLDERAELSGHLGALLQRFRAPR